MSKQIIFRNFGSEELSHIIPVKRPIGHLKFKQVINPDDNYIYSYRGKIIFSFIGKDGIIDTQKVNLETFLIHPTEHFNSSILDNPKFKSLSEIKIEVMPDSSDYMLLELEVIL